MKKFSKLMLVGLMIPALAGVGTAQAGLRFRDPGYGLLALPGFALGLQSTLMGLILSAVGLPWVFFAEDPADRAKAIGIGLLGAFFLAGGVGTVSEFLEWRNDQDDQDDAKPPRILRGANFIEIALSPEINEFAGDGETISDEKLCEMLERALKYDEQIYNDPEEACKFREALESARQRMQKKQITLTEQEIA